MKIVNFSQETNAFRFIVQFSGNINEEIEWLCQFASAITGQNFSIEVDYDPNDFRESISKEVYENPLEHEVSLIVNYNFDKSQLAHSIDSRKIKKA